MRVAANAEKYDVFHRGFDFDVVNMEIRRRNKNELSIRMRITDAI